MPKRKNLWASWNYLGDNGGKTALTYWMNSLQPLATSRDIFVTLNPTTQPKPESVLGEFAYQHPIFDHRAMAAQQRFWMQQGRRRTWFCGAYFGSGFHEDGLQAGLAVAEELGGVRRPWTVPNESSRIFLAARSIAIPDAMKEAAE
jgi:predicted NAD/FAD-binding protein